MKNNIKLLITLTLLIIFGLSLIRSELISAQDTGIQREGETLESHFDYDRPDFDPPAGEDMKVSMAALPEVVDKIYEPKALGETISLPIVSRDEWGCPDTNPASPSYCKDPSWGAFSNPISHIIVHHTVTKNETTDWKAEVRYVWELHAKKNGWNDIGYNYLIDPNGVIYEGKYGGEGTTGGHTYLNNVGTIGIALLGNFEQVDVTPKTLNSLERLMNYLFVRYKLDPNEVGINYDQNTMGRLSGHRDWANTQCPGINAYNKIKSFNKDIGYNVAINKLSSFKTETCLDGFVSYKDTCRGYNTVDQWKDIAQGLNNIIIEGETLYSINSSTNQIHEISKNGNPKKIFDLPSYASSIVKDPLTFTFYTTQYNEGAVYISYKYNVDGLVVQNTKKYADTGRGTNDVIMTEDGLFTADSLSSTVTNITSLNNSETYAETGAFPIALAIDSKKNIFTANYLDNTITKIYQDKSTQTFESTGRLPIDILIDEENDNVYVLNEGSSSITLITANEEISNLAELEPFGNSFYLHENKLYVTHSYTSAISIVDVTTGRTSYIENVGDRLSDILVDVDDKVYITSLSGKLSTFKLNTESMEAIKPVYRFWSDELMSHFFTSSEQNMKTTLATYKKKTWMFEKVAFYVPTASAEATPVHRFWSDKMQAHFYTASEEDKNIVLTKWPDVWKYEGTDFLAYKEKDDKLVPVYRFWSESLEVHFYTTDESEKTKIQTQMKDVWDYEEIAFYVYQNEE